MNNQDEDFAPDPEMQAVWDAFYGPLEGELLHEYYEDGSQLLLIEGKHGDLILRTHEEIDEPINVGDLTITPGSTVLEFQPDCEGVKQVQAIRDALDGWIKRTAGRQP